MVEHDATPGGGGRAPNRAPAIERVTQAAGRARMTRARFLARVLDGSQPLVSTPWVVCETGDRRLLRIRLRQLLATAPRWDRVRADGVVDHVASVLEVPATDVRDAAVAWLVNPHAAGRRVLAWLDSFRPRRQPWPGFPFAAVPVDFDPDDLGPAPTLARRRDRI